MAWDKKPKLTKMHKVADLLEKAVSLEIKNIQDKMARVKKIIEVKKKANELAAKSNRPAAS
jgi:hypothetical protein